MKISWRTVAVVAAIVMTGLLIALIVVATNLDVDALATTALALAVIAFSAQLIVYVAQVADSSETRRQALEVNASTQASLARIGTTVANSDQLLREQNTQLVGELLGNFRRKAVESKESETTFGFGDAVEMLESQAGGAPTGRTSFELEPDYQRVEFHPSEFDLWPDEDEMDDARKAHAVLRELDPISIGQVVRFAQDEKLSDMLGVEVGRVYAGAESAPFSAALLERGLIRTTGKFTRGRPRKDGSRNEYAVLTDLGKTAAKLLLAEGRAPEHIRELARP